MYLVVCYIGYGSLVMWLIGVLANCIAIAALTRNKELSSYFFNWLLTTLAILDSMFLTCGAYDAIRQHLYQSYYMDYTHVILIHPLRSMLMVSSIYMLVVLSYERYKAVSEATTYQGNINEIFNPWCHLGKYLMPVLIGSTLLCIPKFFEQEISYRTITASANLTSGINVTTKTISEIGFAQIRHNRAYVLWYVTVLNTLVTSIVPFLSLVYLNSKIYLGLQQVFVRRSTLRSSFRAQRPAATERIRRNEYQTTVLFLIVWVFLFCHVLRLILNIAEIINHENERKANDYRCLGVKYWMLVTTVLSNFLLYVNSSINLFVYCIANEHLRGILGKNITSISQYTKKKALLVFWYYA